MPELSLLTKVAILMSASMGFGAIGAWTSRRVESGWAILGLGLLFIVGAVGVMIAAKTASTAVGVSVLFAWVFVSGLFVGPFFQMFHEELGGGMLTLVFAGSAAVMAVCGGIGMLSGVDFSGMGAYLGVGLLGLIVVGVIGLFVSMSRTVNLVYSVFGMVIFSGYFVFDFFLLGKTENTWSNAILLTQKLWLDFINFALHFAQFLLLIADKK